MLRSTKFIKRTGVVSENAFLQLKETSIDFVRDLTMYSKNQLRFKLSSRSEPQLYCDFNEDYYYMVSCVDSNQDYDQKPPKNIYACCANVQCKAFAFKDKPRYICRGRCSNTGKKYMLEIANKYTVVVRATDILQLYDFLRCLCCDCLYPKFNCCCSEFDNEFTSYWNICNSKTGKLHRENDNELVLVAYRVLPQSLGLTNDQEQVLFLLENLIHWFRCIQRSASKYEMAEHTLALVRAITGKSFVTMSVDYFLKIPEFTIFQDGNEWFESLDELYLHYSKLKDTTLGKRYMSMFSHTIAHLIYYKLGINVDSKMYAMFEAKHMPTAWEALTFMDAVVGVISITIKVGVQSFRSGSLLPFFVDGTSIGKWHSNLMMALAEYEAVNCPEVCNKTSTQIIDNLDNAIEEGQLLVKSTLNEFARANISKLLGAAIVKRTKQKVLNATSRIRKCPFAIIIYGAPGIGKTDVMSVLRVSLSGALNYDPSQDNVYIHEGSSDHYDGYTESKAVVIVDDAAQLKYNANNPDTSVLDLIKMRNNVAFNMPMADLSDKGKVPFRPSLLMVSTNVRDLHVNHIFSAPFAIMRRFIHITVTVKEEYKSASGELMPDPELVESGELYCPYWNFSVSIPVKPNSSRNEQGDNNTANWIVAHDFESWEDLLAWLIPLAKDHNEKQVWFVQRNQMENAVCDSCKFPVRYCQCDILEQNLFTSSAYRNLRLSPELWATVANWRDLPRLRILTPVNHPNYIENVTNFLVSYAHDNMADVDEAMCQQVVSDYIMSNPARGSLELCEDFPRYINWYNHHLIQDRQLAQLETRVCNNTNFSVWTKIKSKTLGLGLTLYFQYRLVRTSLWYISDLYLVRWFVLKYILPEFTVPSLCSQLLRRAGDEFRKTWFYRDRWYIVVFGASYCAGFFGTKKLMEMMIGRTKNKDRSKMQSLSDYKNKPEPVEEQEQHNVWKYSLDGLTPSNFKPNNFASLDQVHSAIVTNMVLVEIKTSSYSDVTRGLILGNDAILVNKHIKQDHVMDMKITFMNRKKIRTECEVKIEPNQFIDMEGRDVSIVLTKNIPAIVQNVKKTLNNCLPVGEPTGHMDGYYLIKQFNGDIVKHRVYDIRMSTFCTSTGEIFKAWKSFSETPTNNGECGSLLFADTKRGPLLLGIHSALDMDPKNGGYYMFASPILESDYEYCSGCSVGEIKNVVYQDKKVGFLDYHENANIIHHGELVTHGVRYKSSVIKTSIHSYVIQRENFGDFYAAPPMHRWKPQQLSLREIISPVVNFRESSLMLAAKNFLGYLMESVPESELSLLEVYDYETAVNGMDGVNYVDSINRKTSMGFPYKCSKTKYLTIVDGKAYFTPAVKEDIDMALVKMEEGIRPHCIFSANLKDEPISKKEGRNE